MTPRLWELTVAAIQSVSNVPTWLKEQARFSFEDVTRLPPLDTALDGDNVRPSVEEQLVKNDYLDFLRGQIKLEPRGPEWTKVLKERLSSLEPFINKKVIRGMFCKKPDSVTIRINPENGTIIQVENE